MRRLWLQDVFLASFLSNFLLVLANFVICYVHYSAAVVKLVLVTPFLHGLLVASRSNLRSFVLHFRHIVSRTAVFVSAMVSVVAAAGQSS